MTPVTPDVAPIAEVRLVPAQSEVSAEQAQVALARLQGVLPSTRFVAAWPAQLPGFVAVKLESGEVGYTDKGGRYFIFGLVIDTATGQALDKQLEGHP